MYLSQEKPETPSDRLIIKELNILFNEDIIDKYFFIEKDLERIETHLDVILKRRLNTPKSIKLQIQQNLIERLNVHKSILKDYIAVIDESLNKLSLINSGEAIALFNLYDWYSIEFEKLNGRIECLKKTGKEL